MLRTIAVGLLCVIGAHTAGASAFAKEDEPVSLVSEYDAKSKYRLDYSDLNSILGSTVLEMGPSTHKRARKLTKKTGTSIRKANPLPSRFESNRVMLHEFNKNQIEVLGLIRDDLLAIPEQLSLAKLNRNEQLAYWFNLHTAIVLAKVADMYPVTLLEKVFSPERKSSFFHKRAFNLNGQMISLADIQHHVLTNWEDPRVIYGFYMGVVGTPNVRDTAYSGGTVFEALEENAVDFINSIRGTQIWHKELRVSTFYRMMAAQFPNFEEDLMAHIKSYARGNFKSRLRKVDKIKVSIKDWHIADLYNGKLSAGGGNHAGTTATREGLSNGEKMPDHVMDLLRHRATQLTTHSKDKG